MKGQTEKRRRRRRLMPNPLVVHLRSVESRCLQNHQRLDVTATVVVFNTIFTAAKPPPQLAKFYCPSSSIILPPLKFSAAWFPNLRRLRRPLLPPRGLCLHTLGCLAEVAFTTHVRHWNNPHTPLTHPGPKLVVWRLRKNEVDKCAKDTEGTADVRSCCWRLVALKCEESPC